GTPFQSSPSLTQSSELATRARCWSGVMARLTGGPVIVFISGRLATIRGLVGSRMSMIDTVSLPAAWRTVLPVSSNDIFSSLPVIKSRARVPLVGASSEQVAALSASSRGLVDAVERVQWYAKRWGIEVFHRILKSGCQIEDRQLATADRLEAFLAIAPVVAWRIPYLTGLGRVTPDLPCTVAFDDDQWKAVIVFKTRQPPPEQPPSLRAMTRSIA